MDRPLARLQALVRGLPSGLQDHLYRVRDVALELASQHKVDASRVVLAALGHDIARATPPDELLRQARAQDLAVHPVEERVPVLLHGPLAALKLKLECGVTDSEVLEAVRWHSTCCAGLGKVGLVVFLADKLDPHKVEGMPHLRRVAELARASLEQATVDYLTWEITSLLQRGSVLHPASVEARNELLMRMDRGS
ncbi:MAG: bis(5'-nucleosyl)-tetraphosphatase (symmetrical) YqeK [Chloroflexi bacterium]|nr:bis(5'-nucleosyl)-tetraphosphatase (symmetrical) YqeK [Chloroflexota bacterium]